MTTKIQFQNFDSLPLATSLSATDILLVKQGGILKRVDFTKMREAWTTPTLLNGWVNYNLGYEAAGYYKDIFGVVRIRGLIKSGSIGTFVVFSLPVGFRPTKDYIFTAFGESGLYRLDVKSSGDVMIISGGPGNAFVSITCSFLAEQ